MTFKKPYIDQIKEYIKRNLKKGYTKESLNWALINQGHSKFEIERAFNLVEKEMSKEAPILKTKPKITYQRFDQNNNIQKLTLKRKSFWKRFLD
jgi:hypothetical protein